MPPSWRCITSPQSVKTSKTMRCPLDRVLKPVYQTLDEAKSDWLYDPRNVGVAPPLPLLRRLPLLFTDGAHHLQARSAADLRASGSLHSDQKLADSTRQKTSATSQAGIRCSNLASDLIESSSSGLPRHHPRVKQSFRSPRLGVPVARSVPHFAQQRTSRHFYLLFLTSRVPKSLAGFQRPARTPIQLPPS